MIITKKLKIIVHGVNIKYYKDLGYDIPCSNTEIEISVNELPKGSSIKIDCSCDVCGSIKKIAYRRYLQSFNSGEYYSCQKCHKIKSKKTILEKYGVKNISQISEVKNKKIKKSLEKYGHINVFQSDEIKEKIKNTFILRYGGIGIASSIIKEKTRITNLEKYNCENVFQNENIKIKSHQKKLEKYNDKNYNNREQSKNTCLKKYGVKYPLQNYIIHNKQQISSFRIKKFENLTYQGSYELDFLSKYYSIINISKPTSIKYIFENVEKYYFPDFYYKKFNLIIEIKSDYYFSKFLEKNLAKQKACIEQGYNFIFIINKNYSIFENIIN